MNRHTPKEHLTTYDSDFYQWSLHQAALVRERRFSELDLENIAEEIESLGRSDRRSLASHMIILVAHLLKWQFQSGKRSTSWDHSIFMARLKIAEIIAESPSLSAYPASELANIYGSARKLAAKETKLKLETFPVVCPYPISKILDETFMPD